MGKKDGAHRTKGNVKPSSSARTAELLSTSTAGTVSATADFSAGIFGLNPLTPEEAELIPDELKMTLKKLSKKDVTTKLKALQEFCNLTEDAEVAEAAATSEAGMKLVMPYWPRLYTRLANDPDRRIRETAQRAHLIVVSRVGRDLAPFLKSLAPVWHLSCADPHAPAAALAMKAFEAAFPDEVKRREAILFCHEEILTSIRDNLLHSSPSSLSDPKTTSPEDMEEKHLRVVGNSLNGYARFLDVLAVLEEQAKLAKLVIKDAEMHSAILRDSKFWKLAHHVNSQIRQGWYGVAGSLCKHWSLFAGKPEPEIDSSAAILESKHVDKLVSNVMGKLDETETLVVSRLWDAALMLTQNHKDWHRHVDVEKSVLPKILKLLNGASYFLAGIYPRLLPLMHKMPRRIFEADFVTKFLSAIRSGLPTFISAKRSTILQQHQGNQAYGAQSCVRAFFEVGFYALNCAESDSMRESVNREMFSWLSTLLDISKTGSGDKEADLVFGEFSRQMKNRQNDEKMWAKIDCLIGDCDSTERLFRFLYALGTFGGATSETNRKALKQGRDGNEVKSTVRFGGQTENSTDGKTRLNSTKFFPPIALEELANLKSATESKVKSSLQQTGEIQSQQGVKSTASRTRQQVLQFSISALRAFTNLDNVGFESQLMDRLIAPEVLQLNEQEGSLNLHVELCVILLNRFADESVKKNFYESLTKLESPDWISSFIGGLLQDQETIEDPTLKSLLSGEAYAKKLIKSLDQPTPEALRLLLTSMKYVSLMSKSSVGELLRRASSSGFDDGSTCPRWFLSELIRILHVSAGEAVWQLAEAELLVERLALIDNNSNRGEHDKNFKEDWVIGFDCIGKHGGSSRQRLLAGKIARTIRDEVVICDSKNRQKLSVLAKQASLLLAYVSNAGDKKELFDVLVENEVSHEPVMESAVAQLMTGLNKQRLTCMDEFAAVEVMWPKNKTVFYTELMELLEGDASFSDVSQVPKGLMSILGHDLTTSAASKFEFSRANLWPASPAGGKLLASVRSIDSDWLIREILAASEAGGYLWAVTLAFAVSKLSVDPSEMLLSLHDKTSTVTTPILHTLQALIPLSNINSVKTVKNLEAGKIISLQQQAAEANAESLPDQLLASLALFRTCGDFCDDREDNAAILAAISDWKQNYEDLFLYSCSDLTSRPWNEVMFVVTVCDILTAEVALEAEVANKNKDNNWDLVLCSLSSWMQSVEENRGHFMESAEVSKQCLYKVSLFTQSVLRLAEAVASRMQNLEATDGNGADLVEEWNEFFAATIFPPMLSLFVDLATAESTVTDLAKEDAVEVTASEAEEADKGSHEGLLAVLGDALRLIPMDQLIQHSLPARFLASDVDATEASLPDNLVFLLNHVAPLLEAKSRSVQSTAFHLLQRAMAKILEAEEARHNDNTSVKMTTSSGHEDEMRPIPRRLGELLERNELVLDTLFSSIADLTFGEPLPAALPVNSAAYTSAMTYLLTWRLVLSLMAGASAELRPKYTEYLRHKNHMKSLMNTLYHLMTMKDADNKTKRFGDEPRLDCVPENVENLENGSELKDLACSVYHSLLKHLPALVRNWWNLADKKTAGIVERFTCSRVTPTLWSEEVDRINQSKAKFDNMSIKVRSVGREVVAVYTMDEASMELVVQLPANFPLGAVTVDSGKRVGVTTAQWRTWMLQLTTFLQHQNGSILDGLTVWKNNVDKRFEGVEECYICFYVLHGSNHQLPKVACPTCKKKFHSACLYKWFSTSNNSTCPLCRNLF